MVIVPPIDHPIKLLKVATTIAKGLLGHQTVAYAWRRSGRDGRVRGGHGVAEVHKDSVDECVSLHVSDNKAEVLDADDVLEHPGYLPRVEVYVAGDKVLDKDADGSVLAILAGGILARVVNVPGRWVKVVLVLKNLLVLFLEEEVAVALGSQVLATSLFQAAISTAFVDEEFPMVVKILPIWNWSTVGPMAPMIKRVKLELITVN